MIQIPPLTDDINTLKRAIEKIAREAQSTQNPGGQEDQVYVDTAPGVDDIKEGQFVPYLNAGVYKVYTKLDGVIKSWTLA